MQGDATLYVDLAEDTYVESRQDFDGAQSRNEFVILQAKGGGGGGRGFTGRGTGAYENAPRRNGWAIYHGGDYTDDWREDHRDDIERYEVAIVGVGVEYFGTNAEFQDDKPGPGAPEDWDRRFDNPEDAIEYTLQEAGWYRVGTLTTPVGTTQDFDTPWECFDIRVEEENGSLTITERWKVAPRL